MSRQRTSFTYFTCKSLFNFQVIVPKNTNVITSGINGYQWADISCFRFGFNFLDFFDFGFLSFSESVQLIYIIDIKIELGILKCCDYYQVDYNQRLQKSTYLKYKQINKLLIY
ncbi:Hypothetical_protein [Hexamita inflata]|uniref:Hypothetical_protein n=1 Tax=Hexamita inflata TaxID=28002 RepID=A0AA86PDJ9_9EUKA|nr:Hypothetical protein HINF_LOCUS23471 [Hexamita inflata]